MTWTLTTVKRALLAAVTLIALAAMAPTMASAASTPGTALINGDSVTLDDGIENAKAEKVSLEQYAAENAGYKATVVSGAEWDAMSAPQFAQYQVLIVGDPDCGETAESVNSNASTWAPVVMGTAGLGATEGNRTLVGTDPEDHFADGGGGASPTIPGDPASAGAEHLVQDGIAFAGGVPGATGLYYDTTCEDPGTDVATLDQLTTAGAGQWEENTEPPCGGNVAQVASNPAFSSGATKLTDFDIEGWQCSVHIAFPLFPADWNPLAVATDTDTKPTCGTDPESSETVCGQAYVLVSGIGIVATSPNLSLTPVSGSDPAGGTHSVTATVVQEQEIPEVRAAVKPNLSLKVAAPGQVVSFAISGQNGGVTGTCTTPAGAADPTCTTDANGQVVFTYADAHGAGTDTINASVDLEGSTQHATASETWVAALAPPVTAKATTTTTTTVKAGQSEVLAFGAAHLASSPPACVASTGYLASVAGKSISSVTFTLDGHKIATLHHSNHKGGFATRVKVRPGSKHRLTIHVVFTAASKTKALTIKRTLAHCAAVRHVATPRFTG
jgi:hypothetical protein